MPAKAGRRVSLDKPREELGGDESQLVEMLYAGLRRFAAVVAPFDVEPDDLVQEALARALRVRPLAEYDDLGSYVRKAMLHIAANERRRSDRFSRALVRLIRSRDARTPEYPSDLALLKTLPPDVRAVLYLAEVEQWTFAEVAELLGCSETAARARASRGRRTLRSVLEADDG